MTDTIELLALLREVLGPYKEYPHRHEVVFRCPLCNHPKKKLQVNLESGSFHCWVCEVSNGTAGRSFFSLFRKVGASSDQVTRLANILGESLPSLSVAAEHTDVRELPKEFISLAYITNSAHYRHARFYLQHRNVTDDDIVKYNIGYIEDGRYRGKVIIPSYGEDGKLNFFVGRAYHADDPMKHLTPSWTKDVVGFEAFINWSMPIVLVEGVFDAMAVKVNAIPLFGKTVNATLRQRITEHKVETIYVALDRDAVQNSVKYVQAFLGEGRKVFLVELPGKDPSEIGFVEMQRLLRTARPSSFLDIMRVKLS